MDDPKQLLLDADQALWDNDLTAAAEYLERYWRFRRQGGREQPSDGDCQARSLERRLKKRLKK